MGILPGIFLSTSCFGEHCLGPECVNPPSRPRCAEGTLEVTGGALWWAAEMDGLEYGITAGTRGHYLEPEPEWGPGFEAGLTYISCFDGWDFGLLWTHFEGKATSSKEKLLYPLWSDFVPTGGQPLTATHAHATWKVHLDLVDIELGRAMEMGCSISFRPFIGLRVAYIHQDYEIEYNGGSFGAFQDRASLHSWLEGVGGRIGIDLEWTLCGCFCFYGGFAANLIPSRRCTSLHENWEGSTTEILSMRRGDLFYPAVLDFEIGLSYTLISCNCCRALTFQAGWEEHIFFSFNPFWRVQRGNLGENLYYQRTGDLGLQGWTLRVLFEF